MQFPKIPEGGDAGERNHGMTVELDIYAVTYAEQNKPSWFYKYIYKS
jgi:hypothetical protein